MNLVLIIGIVAASLCVLVCAFLFWIIRYNRYLRLKHWNFTKSDVIYALDNILGLNAPYFRDFDMFLDYPMKDEYLESIRQRAIKVCERYHWQSTPDYDLGLATEGQSEIEKLLNELRALDQ